MTGMAMVENEAPRAWVQLLYNNQDVTRDVSPFVESIEFTDALDAADDLQITMADPERVWIRGWAPSKGASLGLVIFRKAARQVSQLSCGTFYLDTCKYVGGVVTIGASSADLSKALRKQDRSRAWEQVSLRRVLEDVARTAGLQLQYLWQQNPTYKRIEQRKESDLAFVQRIARNEDLLLKVTNGKLVVTPPSDYETAPAATTFSIDDPRISSRPELSSQIVDNYGKVRLRYRHSQDCKVHEYEYTVPGAPEDAPTLEIHRRCESVAQAERMAKAALGRNHRACTVGSFTLFGDTSLVAGLNIELDASWGIYAGKYALPEVKHSYSRTGGYVTEISPRGVYAVA